MKNKQIYFENLDGFRAIAAFLVVFYHVVISWDVYPETVFYKYSRYILSFGGNGGPFGVMFFFVLSGFLITYLLFLEKDNNGSINIPFFYFRRLIRIWPLYYLTVFIGFFIYPLFATYNGSIYIEKASLFMYSIFAVNLDHLYNSEPCNGVLRVQWSVAIEEQFYLVWPLIFSFFSNKKIFPYLMLLLILISEWFYLKADNWDIGYYHTISNFRFLMFGCLLAYLCYFKIHEIHFYLNKINKNLSLLIYFIALMLLFFNNLLIGYSVLFKYINHFLPFLFFGYVIVEQNFYPHSFYKIGRFKILTCFGKISYGLYLTHMIAISIVYDFFSNPTGEDVLLEIVITLILTVLFSYLSYNYMERYFLSFRNKYTQIRRWCFKVT